MLACMFSNFPNPNVILSSWLTKLCFVLLPKFVKQGKAGSSGCRWDSVNAFPLSAFSSQGLHSGWILSNVYSQASPRPGLIVFLCFARPADTSQQQQLLEAALLPLLLLLLLVQVETDKLVPARAECDGDGGVKATVVTLLSAKDRATTGVDTAQGPGTASAWHGP